MAGGTSQSSVRASSLACRRRRSEPPAHDADRLYSARQLGYCVPAVNAILYIMYIQCDGWTVVYHAERS